MKLVTTASELLENIETLKKYLQSSGADRDFALDLVRQGICFVITEENTTPFFAPSRFIGYKDNTREDHLQNDDKDGRETNAALEVFLKGSPSPSEPCEQEYEQFCARLGIQLRKAPFGISRKFWDLR
jgi:5-methylcytosine-specific restriction protein A